MKKAVIALLGLLLAGVALAQTAGTNTVAQGGYYFNSKTGQKTDADGNAYTSEASRDRDYYFRHASVVDDTIAVGMADSSAYYDTHAASRMWLKLKVAPASGAAPPLTRLAIRVHGSFANPALGDTNEIAVWNTTRAATGIDSLSYVRSTAPTSVAFANYEFVVEIKEAEAGKWGEETTAYVPLCDNRGVFFWAPYTAITVRALGGSGVTRVRADILGTAVR